MVCDGQRVAVLTIAELELAFEVGAPQMVGRCAGGELGAGCAMTRPADALDQAVPMQNSVNRALGGDAHVLIQAAHQQLANLARAPVWLLALERNNQDLDLRRQLV